MNISEAEEKELRKRYRFLRKDFAKQKTKSMHSDLEFDITPDRVCVRNITTFLHDDDEPLEEFIVDANNLEILKISYLDGSNYPKRDKILPNTDWQEHIKYITSDDIINSWNNDIKYEYNKIERKIHIKLPIKKNKDEQFTILFETRCHPNKNMLEGLYFDYTPNSCPQTIISQCQQYGFQRITPSIDQMLNKQVYTTTIIADESYTNMITNGDVVSEYLIKSDNSLPRPKYKEPTNEQYNRYNDVDDTLAKKRYVIKYINCSVPMATYLFFLGVGTYVTYYRNVEYPDGDIFQIELLTFPNITPPESCVEKLDSIFWAVLWVHLSTGPEAMKNVKEREELYKLLHERENIIKQIDMIYNINMNPCDTSIPIEKIEKSVSINLPSKEELNKEYNKDLTDSEKDKLKERLNEIRKRTKEQISVWKKPGYKYTGQVYREIAMENSQYGGMENVGNTTIISSAIAMMRQTTDACAVYNECVTVHEYYHNQNGSEVTGASPFEMWLNEAVTVWIERKRSDELFGKESRRLSILRYALTPASGPLDIDSSPNSMAIEPIGFNSTMELVSAMTYSKAPEFVNMIMLLIGEDSFFKALDDYYTKFSHSNATTYDWIHSMEEIGKRDLQNCARGWQTRTGHPTLHYKTIYDKSNQKYIIKLNQKGYQDKNEYERYPWEFPVLWSIVKDGKSIKDGMHVMKDEYDEICIDNITNEPDYASIGCNWSFFGRVRNDDSINNIDIIEKQALSDPDVINRMLSYISFVDTIVIKSINILETITEYDDIKIQKTMSFNALNSYVNLFMTILRDNNLSEDTRASIQQITRYTMDTKYNNKYWQLFDMSIALKQSLFYQHGTEIINQYKELDDDKYYNGVWLNSTGQRSQKSVLLSCILCAYKYEPILTLYDYEIQPYEDFSILDACERLLSSKFATDRIIGLSTLQSISKDIDKEILPQDEYLGNYIPKYKLRQQNDIDFNKREMLLKKAKEDFISHPDSLSSYIAILSSMPTPLVFEQVDNLLKESFFKIELAGHARTLARGWIVNRNLSLLTKTGLQKTIDLATAIAKVNEMSSYPFLQSFSDINSMDPNTKKAWIEALKTLISRFDPIEQQSVYNNISRILDSAGATI